MSKDKQTVKVYSIDLNLDVKRVLPELLYQALEETDRVAFQKELNDWAAKPEATRGNRPVLNREKMTGAEFFKDIVMKALQMAHKTGNTASLRRTKSIADLFDYAIESKKGILEVMDEDFKYIKSSVAKGEDWTNTEDIARAVLLVEDALNGAEESGK